MPRSDSKRREQENEKLNDEFQKSGRFKGRKRGAVAPLVNKQRDQHLETASARAEEKRDESPDRNLPIQNYDALNVEQVTKKLGSLSRDEVQGIMDYELTHKKRKTVIEQFDKILSKEAKKNSPGLFSTMNWSWILIGVGALLAVWLIL